MDRELVGDRRVIAVRDADGCEQRGEDVAVLAGFAGGERRERADGEAEVEGDAVDVASTDAGAGEDQHPMLGQERAELVDDREDRVLPAVHDGAPTDLDDLQPGQERDRPPPGDRTRQLAVEKGLTRQRRDDVLDVGRVGHGLLSRRRGQLAVMMVPTWSPASARVRLPGTRPLTTCTCRTCRAVFRRASIWNSTIESSRPRAFISSTEICGMNVASVVVFGFA